MDDSQQMSQQIMLLLHHIDKMSLCFNSFLQFGCKLHIHAPFGEGYPVQNFIMMRSGVFDLRIGEIVFTRLLFRLWVLPTRLRRDHYTDFDA